MTRKEYIKAKCMQLLFGWECSPCWHKFAHIVELFIMDAFVDLFITLCIVINTMFMALDHYGMDTKLEETLVSGNYVSLPACHWKFPQLVCPVHSVRSTFGYDAPGVTCQEGILSTGFLASSFFGYFLTC